MISIKKTTLAASLCAAFSAAAPAEEPPAQQVTKAHEHVIQQAPGSYFSGSAEFSRFPLLPSSGDVAPAIVRFAANTVTNWHIHPHGQYLIVTEGVGRTQEWGKAIQTLNKGDVVWCPPGVKHWHGATEHSAMTHIAISPVTTDGQQVTWLEKVDLPTSEQTAAQQAKINPVILSEKQLSLIPIAGFNATGNLDKLKPALVKGLESGLTVNEIKEVFAHQYAYVGFPRALNGMLTLRSLLEQRQQQGIKDIEGAQPKALASDTNYYQLGNETLAYLSRIPLERSSQPLFDNFSPTIDHALKAHLFGYLFSRDNLGYLERELVVTSSLSALGNVNAQLRSHLRIAGNLGVDETQMRKVMAVLEQELGAEVAKNAQSVLLELK